MSEEEAKKKSKFVTAVSPNFSTTDVSRICLAINLYQKKISKKQMISQDFER
jgi:hypothetical protein